ncbi:response regulator [Rhizobiaceae bacterium n13]|uniref:Response regulator n=1 Tax=Ferirhizobium litorale TaxID=2927786 RepID=A0AAE3QD91_9HYPH|nr:response regulator [Fererhizobium litorale]MDI7861818.1 response regulator [Fererhizobium litorale]MDI7921840.1 response regulator [Fererhizobium litorale]
MTDIERDTHTPTILCVEDEEDLRLDIAEELQSAGYRVLEAGNGREALATIKEHRPDLILCDITMPDLDGYGLMEAIRKHAPDFADVPFLFLTALGGRMDMLRGMAAGADDYLVKPIDYDMLLARVKARLSQVGRIRDSIERSHEVVRLSVTKSLQRGIRETVDALASSLDRLVTGFVLLDATGRVVCANETARAIIADGDAIIQTPTGLTGINRTATQQFREALAATMRGEHQEESVLLPRDYGNPVQMHFLRLGHTGIDGEEVAALLIDPDRRRELSPDAVRKMYGLTPAEARLCVALANGKRLDEISDDFGIAPTTIAFHLKNVFRKTQTSRQSELVLLLNRISFA